MSDVPKLKVMRLPIWGATAYFDTRGPWCWEGYRMMVHIGPWAILMFPKKEPAQ